MHVALGALCVVGFGLQLAPFLRTRWPSVHRALGYAMLPIGWLFVAEIVYTMFVVGMVPMGTAVYLADVFSVGCMAAGMTFGLAAIKRGEVATHQKWLTLAVAGLLMNPVMRLVWTLLARANVMGPYTDWPMFRDGVTALSAVVTLGLNLSVWAWFAFAPSPSGGVKGGTSKAHAT